MTVLEDILTSAVRAGVQTLADAATHVVATPTRVAANAFTAVGVTLISYMVVGSIKLGCSGAWWLGSAAINGVGMASNATYSYLFPPSHPAIKYTDDWHEVNERPSKRSISFDDISSPTSPTSPK